MVKQVMQGWILCGLPEERNSGDGFYIRQECDTGSLYISVKEKWEHVSVVQKGF